MSEGTGRRADRCTAPIYLRERLSWPVATTDDLAQSIAHDATLGNRVGASWDLEGLERRAGDGWRGRGSPQSATRSRDAALLVCGLA